MPTSYKPSARPTAANWSITESLADFLTPRLIATAVAVLLLSSLLAWFIWPRVDDKEMLDLQIEQSWQKEQKTVDAFAFFAKGGVYENQDRDGARNIDQQYVIPLITLLRDKHHLQVMVIEHKDLPNTAFAVVAQAPKTREERNAVRKTFLEVTDSFPGLATLNWSHKLVSIDFFDELEMAPMIEANVVEPLKASQRRME